MKIDCRPAKLVKKGSLLQYIKGDQLNSIVEVVGVIDKESAPWSDCDIFELSNGQSVSADSIVPGNTEDPYEYTKKNTHCYMIQISSKDNDWIFEDVSPQYTPDNDIPFSVVYDKDGKRQELPNPNFVPQEKRIFEYKVKEKPFKPFEEDYKEPECIKQDNNVPNTLYLRQDDPLVKDSTINPEIDLSSLGGIYGLLDNIQKDLNALKEKEKETSSEVKPSRNESMSNFQPEPNINLEDIEKCNVVIPIIDSCKKVKCSLNLDFDAMLVDHSIMQVINKQFGEDYENCAIEYILSSISYETIINSIRSALKEFYKIEEIEKEAKEEVREINEETKLEDSVKSPVKTPEVKKEPNKTTTRKRTTKSSATKSSTNKTNKTEE